ncbi:hypothetical protein VP01_348g5 [Puccinia sorghi]|uniref:Uncharacterized protein n=1 Tax=Puccinia sorghi TaxID=27349 RepID=A0A0L6UVV1_9BASI|nr:hypothetical protein VP01_348g5 [Puccinia sorghi]
MSYFLPHLPSGWHVDQAIIAEENRVVIIRFGHDWARSFLSHGAMMYPVKTSCSLKRLFNPLRTGPYLKRFGMHADGRNPVWHLRKSEELCRHLFGRYHQSPRFHQDCRCTNCMIHVRSWCFFYRNKHIMIDLGTGNNNKINWAMDDKQELIDIVETIYRGASKGRGLVVSPKDYSTRYKYY